MEIGLTYDRLGSRLVRIGAVALTYKRLGSWPRTLGHLELRYDQLGSRLRAIGGYRIDYDQLGSRPRTLGSWRLDYDGLMGSRLCRVGPFPVTYRSRWSGRVETIGPMRLDYDRLGSRVWRVRLPAELTRFPDDLLLALFFVLHHVETQQEIPGHSHGFRH